MISEDYAARLAGFMYVFVIVLAGVSMVLLEPLASMEDLPAVLTAISGCPGKVRLGALLLTAAGISTIVLATMLFAVLKKNDYNLAFLAFACRLGEAVLYAGPVICVLSLLYVSQRYTGLIETNSPAVDVVGGVLLRIRMWCTELGGILFSVGSVLYCYLFIKSELIPKWLSIFGVLASIMVSLILVFKMVDLYADLTVNIVWYVMVVFEMLAGLWLLVNGASLPAAKT